MTKTSSLVLAYRYNGRNKYENSAPAIEARSGFIITGFYLTFQLPALSFGSRFLPLRTIRIFSEVYTYIR